MKKFIHQWSWTILVIFCIVGIFFPIIGIVAITCMLAPVAVAFFKGRVWCGNFCPRGSLNDILLSKISRKAKLPNIMKKTWFKNLFLIVLMASFSMQIAINWGDWTGVGLVFVRMIIITTLLAIILGTVYNHRAWCVICPMGNLAHYVSRVDKFKQKAEHIKFDKKKCVNCKVCSKNCPIGIDVLSYKDNGAVHNGECIKCNVCVQKCPKKALCMD